MRACAKSREQLLSPGEPRTESAFPFICYYHNYTMAHGDPKSKRQAREKYSEKRIIFFIRVTWMLGALQRQTERGIRYFIFKEQTLLNKAEKEGECRYLTKLDINVKCYAINVEDNFTVVGWDHVERGHWLLLAAHGAICWTKQDKCNSDHAEITAMKEVPLGTSKPLQAKKGDILLIPYWRNILRDFNISSMQTPPRLVPEAIFNLFKKRLRNL